jgi:branched-chain amino acid transport system permease protein
MYLPTATATEQALLQGLLLGGLYALTALGLSLVLGVLRIINLAHGEFLILGAFLGYYWLQWTGIDPLLGLVVVAPVVAGVGFVVQRWALSPLVRHGDEPALLTTFGLSIIGQNLFIILFTADSRLINRSYGTEALTIGSISVPKIYLISFIAALVIFGAVHLLIHRTAFGRRVRASAEDPVAAAVLGVRVRRVHSLTFALAAACAAIGGVLAGVAFSFDATTGPGYLLTGFAVVVLGGLGSVAGTLGGGIVLGVIESVGAAVFGDGYLNFIGLVVFLVILAIRPQGIFGWARR